MNWNQVEYLADAIREGAIASSGVPIVKTSLELAVDRLNQLLVQMGIPRSFNDIADINVIDKIIVFKSDDIGFKTYREIPKCYFKDFIYAAVECFNHGGLKDTAMKILCDYEKLTKETEEQEMPQVIPNVANNEPNNEKRTIKSRISNAFSEGTKRASVEFALEEGQKLLVNEILRGYKCTKSEKQAARKFLLWFFASPAGQVAIAGAVSAGAPFVAGLLGKNGPVIQTVSDEFANRAATITTKEGMRFAAKQLKPLLSMFGRLFDSIEKTAETPVLNESKGSCSVFDIEAERSRVSSR